MSGIFISYRRQDSQGSAGRLADTLKAQFAQSQIFRDIETIEPGVDFVEAIERALASCVVMLAVMGPRWLSATDKLGRRRLDDPNDYTRIEIAAALQRKVRVIPVLVDGAAMPDAEDLPDDLKTLARRQASELSDKRWDFDVRQLVLTLEKIPGIEKRPDARVAGGDTGRTLSPDPVMARGVKMGWWVGVGAALLAGIAFMVWRGVETLEPTSVAAPSYAISRAAPAPAVASDKDSGSASRISATPAAAEPTRPADVPPPTIKREVYAGVASTVQPAPAQPKHLDISGTWIDVFGNRYTLTQQGARVDIRMTLAAAPGRSAEGSGTLSGRTIVFNYYAFRDPQIGSSSGSATVEVAPDGDRIQGTYFAQPNGARLPFLLSR